MAILKKTALSAAFAGVLTNAQAVISLVTIPFVITDNDGFVDIANGSTGSIIFKVDDTVSGSNIGSSPVDFDGAVTEVSGSLDSFNFSDTSAFPSELNVIDNFSVSGDLVDGIRINVEAVTQTSDPDVLISGVILELATSDENLWSAPSTIPGTLVNHFNDLISSGSFINQVYIEAREGGQRFDIEADVTGGSLTAVPEASHFALCAGLVGLGAGIMRRRNKSTVPSEPVGP